jgi:UDP-N-acetylglucosamine acyltransferase
MGDVHSTAFVGKNVELGPGTTVGPHVIIEDGVKMGAHNKILAGAYISSGTQIGDHNEIHMHAIIGHVPQDKAFTGEPTFTSIGDRNIIREFVTIHRGTDAGSSTVIGNENFLMAASHIAHNCVVHNNVVMANIASLSGHCVVEDGAFLSGMVGMHQFVRIGRLAMISALSGVSQDVPPFSLCAGRPAVAHGVNSLGLRRAGIAPDVRLQIKQAYKLIYRSGMSISDALSTIRQTLTSDEVKQLVAFIENSERGIIDASGRREEMS